MDRLRLLDMSRKIPQADKVGPLSSLLRQVVALLVLVAVSAGAAFFLWRSVLTRYEATLSIIVPGGGFPARSGEVGSGIQPREREIEGVSVRLPGGSVRLPDGPTFFRQIEPVLISTSAIEQFAESRGLATDPIVNRFIGQTRAHRSEPVSFTFNYGVSRADYRDLPETFASEILKHSTVRFALVVLVKGQSEIETRRAAEIFVEYVRDTMQRVAVRDLMNQLVLYARTHVARIENELSSIRIRLASINQQTSDLEQIRSMYSEDSSAGTDMVSVPNASSQFEGRRFLSPVRQLVALQTERSDLADRERVIDNKRASLNALDAYVVAVRGGARAERKEAASPLEVAFTALNLLAAPRNSPAEDLAFANVRASVNEALVWLRAELVDQPSEPEEPIVYRAGPSLLVIVGAAVLLSFIVWLALVRGALRGLLR
jgi:hypothetical protein